MTNKAALFFLTMLVLSATLAASIWSDRRDPAVLAQPLDAISTRIEGWSAGPNQEFAGRTLAMLKPTSYLSRTYSRNGSQLDLFVAYYAQQRSGETMHSPKYCLPGGGWEISDSRFVPVSIGGSQIPINRNLIRRDRNSRLVLYWYQTKKRVIASEYLGKFFLVWDGISRGYQGGSIVRLTLVDRPNAEQEGLAFAAELIPQVQRCLRNVADYESSGTITE